MKTTMMMIAIATALMSFNSFADLGETTTDCPWSNDSISRNVDKSIDSSVKEETKAPSAVNQ